MSETLTPFQTTSQDILNLAAASLSAATDLTEAEQTARSQTVIRGTMAFLPTDPAQTVLASLILGHHLAIMDGFRDIACLTLTPTEAARARMVTVAQTKLVLQLLRDLRTTRQDAQPRAEAPTAADPGHATMARFMTTYAETLATLRDTDTLTPEAAATACEALSQAMAPALFAAPGEANSASGPATGSRAQRRAMMKRRGEFKRTA